MKKAWPFILGVLLLVAPVAVQAQFDFTTNADNTLTITNYTGVGGAVTVPASVGGANVTVIGSQAFIGKSTVTSVTISNGITSIQELAFAGCVALSNVSIPQSVTNIEDSVFYECTALGAITFPSNITTIGYAEFEFCLDLTSFVIPVGVTNIGASAFYGCSDLTNVVIPDTVTSIENAAFYQCGALRSLSLPNGLTNIGPAAFFGCSSLTTVTLPTNVNTIGAQVFALCSGLTSFVIPDTVTNIGFSAFYNASSLTNVVIPDSVDSIAGNAFANCASLTSIVIPASVTNLGDSAFQSCSNLTTVVFDGNAPTAGTNIFGSSTNITVYHQPGTTGFTNGFGGLQNTPAQFGLVKVVINPDVAAAAGAQWQVDGGALQVSSATVGGLTLGAHALHFTAATGYVTPPDQSVTVSSGARTTFTAIYAPSEIPASGLILITNGAGTIAHSKWPAQLVVGTKYTITASPKSKNVFVSWIGGTNPPYAVLSTAVKYTFTMRSNLFLEANFVTNHFLIASGAYKGLFAPEDSVRHQSDSGYFAFNVSSAGAVSGSMTVGSQSIPVSGKFSADGAATVISKASRTVPATTTTLQMDFADQSISGTVSNSSFAASLDGDRAVFIGTNKATRFAGQYTLVVPGTTNPAVGPFGDGYGTAKVTTTGAVTLSGSLADGTAFSQSSQISKDGRWPIYSKLYNGTGSIWGWAYLSNSLISAPALSWINATNSTKTAVYRSGFTNQSATLVGAIYQANATLATDQTALLSGGSLAESITNGVTVSSSGKVTLTNTATETNKLSLSIRKTTGIVSGTFANPANPKQTIKVNGVVLQSETNAFGYFLGSNSSGLFLLGP